MDGDISRLKALELDALRELGNIGAGGAATALSKLLGATVHIDVPQVKAVPLTRVPELLGGPETVMAGVYMKVFGDAPCKILVFLPEDAVQALLDVLLPAAGRKPEGLDEAAQSALKELGNILGCSYLNAMSRLLGMQFVPSVPALAVDMVGSIISEAVLDMADAGNEALFIENRFMGKGSPVTGHLLLIPERGTAESLVAALMRLSGA